MRRRLLIMVEYINKECVNREFVNYCCYYTGMCTAPKKQYELCKQTNQDNIRPIKINEYWMEE